MEIDAKVATWLETIINDENVDIVLARYNYQNNDFNSNLILVDFLSPISQGTSDKFDGENEILNYGTYMKSVFTFDFYGQNAYSNAIKFINRQRSQASYDKSLELEITPYNTSTMTNLKELTGTQYQNRFQVELSVGYYEEFNETVLRIDSAEIDLYYEE